MTIASFEEIHFCRKEPLSDTSRASDIVTTSVMKSLFYLSCVEIKNRNLDGFELLCWMKVRLLIVDLTYAYFVDPFI